MTDPSKNVWPDHLMIRDTQLFDDISGPGTRIYTTVGQGYEKRKYIRADLVADVKADAPPVVPLDFRMEALEKRVRWLEDEIMALRRQVPDNR